MIIHQYLSSRLSSVKDCDPRLRFDSLRAKFLRLISRLKSHQRLRRVVILVVALVFVSVGRLSKSLSSSSSAEFLSVEPPLSELETSVANLNAVDRSRLLSLGFGSFASFVQTESLASREQTASSVDRAPCLYSEVLKRRVFLLPGGWDQQSSATSADPHSCPSPRGGLRQPGGKRMRRRLVDRMKRREPSAAEAAVRRHGGAAASASARSSAACARSRDARASASARSSAA